MALAHGRVWRREEGHGRLPGAVALWQRAEDQEDIVVKVGAAGERNRRKKKQKFLADANQTTITLFVSVYSASLRVF
jgi:hypothetical protein